MRRVAAGAVAALWPLPLWAHDAFGDLGPFYKALLHPVVDPLQGLIVIGAAVFLARQPLPAVRLAYPAFALAAFVAILGSSLLQMALTGQRALAVVAAIIGIMAAVGLRPGPVPTAAIAGAAGLAAGSLVDPSPDLLLTVAGGAMGLAVVALLVWGAAELAERRLTPFAGAVVGSWVAAVGLMLTALPA